MATHYLGTTTSGAIVSRKSTRNDFTHAVHKSGSPILPTFGTSADGALRNSLKTWNDGGEVVAVRIVDAKEYRDALKAAKGTEA